MKIYEIKEIIPLVDHVTDYLSLQYIVLAYTELRKFTIISNDPNYQSENCSQAKPQSGRGG